MRFTRLSIRIYGSYERNPSSRITLAYFKNRHFLPKSKSNCYYANNAFLRSFLVPIRLFIILHQKAFSLNGSQIKSKCLSKQIKDCTANAFANKSSTRLFEQKVNGAPCRSYWSRLHNGPRSTITLFQNHVTNLDTDAIECSMYSRVAFLPRRLCIYRAKGAKTSIWVHLAIVGSKSSFLCPIGDLNGLGCDVPITVTSMSWTWGERNSVLRKLWGAGSLLLDPLGINLPLGN